MAQRVARGEATAEEVVVRLEFSDAVKDKDGNPRDVKKNSKVFRGIYQGASVSIYVNNSITEQLGDPSELEVIFRPKA